MKVSAKEKRAEVRKHRRKVASWNLRKFKLRGDKELLSRLWEAGHVRFISTNAFNEGDDVNKVMRRLVKKGLFIHKYERGAFTSGYDWPMTREILESEPMFRALLAEIEENFIIRNGWANQYTDKGEFVMHADRKYSAKYRLVYTILADGKWMHFQKGFDNDEDKRRASVQIPHGCGVVMSKVGGGVLCKNMRHGVDQCGKSFTFTVEIDPKSS